MSTSNTQSINQSKISPNLALILLLRIWIRLVGFRLVPNHLDKEIIWKLNKSRWIFSSNRAILQGDFLILINHKLNVFAVRMIESNRTVFLLSAFSNDFVESSNRTIHTEKDRNWLIYSQWMKEILEELEEICFITEFEWFHFERIGSCFVSHEIMRYPFQLTMMNGLFHIIWEKRFRLE